MMVKAPTLSLMPFCQAIFRREIDATVHPENQLPVIHVNVEAGDVSVAQNGPTPVERYYWHLNTSSEEKSKWP